MFLDEKVSRAWVSVSNLKQFRHRDENKSLNGKVVNLKSFTFVVELGKVGKRLLPFSSVYEIVKAACIVIFLQFLAL